MPSGHHDGLVELFEQTPVETAQLLGRLVGLAPPPGAEVRTLGAVVRTTTATELRAEVVLEIEGGGEKKRLLVVEVQRARDADKPWRWPRYVVVLRDTHRLPVHLVVVATSREVAEWARRPIEALPGAPWRPRVIGPDDLPQPESVPPAERTATGALLAIALQVATIDDLVSVETALAEAWPPADLDDIGGERGYVDKASLLMKPALFRLVEAMMDQTWANDSASILLQRYGALREAGRREGREEGREQGRIETLRSLLLRLAPRHGFAPSPGQVRTIESCDSVDQLTEWVVRLTAGVPLDELVPA